MTLTRVARWLALSLAAGAAWIGLSAPAQAIPVFARQTGHNCQACHISYPELTAYGREFKLNGYTFGESQPFPFALAVMAEYAKIGDNNDHSDPTGATKICTTCNEFALTQWSLFYGGRITDNLGVFGQASSGGFPLDSGSNCCNGFASDNTEIRYVQRFSSGVGTLEDDTVVGLLLNNNASMQDVWHSAPAWRFPWYPYSATNLGPLASTFIEGGGPNSFGDMSGHRVVGLGAYTWYRKNWYAELTLYRAPWGGPFSFMDYGSGQRSDATQPSDSIDGWAPYYRLAYSRDWGYYSAEVGLSGIHAKTYYDALSRDSGNAQRFNDFGIDGQFQFNKNEPWIYSIVGSWIHEKNDLPAIADAGKASGSSHTLNEFNLKGTAYYDRVYGATLAYYQITGSSDPLLYQQTAPGGSATGSPNSAYWMLELNYVPIQDMRFSLNYTAYTKINGGKNNFDGLGNNASGQNLLQFAIWWIY
jgi:hypothetical protein